MLQSALLKAETVPNNLRKGEMKMLAAIAMTVFLSVVCLTAYFFGGRLKQEPFETILSCLLGITLGFSIGYLVLVFLFWGGEFDLVLFLFECLLWTMFGGIILARWWLYQKHSSLKTNNSS